MPSVARSLILHALRFSTVSGVAEVAKIGKLYDSSIGRNGGKSEAPHLPRKAARERRLSAREPLAETMMTTTSRFVRGVETALENARTLRCVACAFVDAVHELVSKTALSTVGRLIPNPDVSVVANNTWY